MTRYYVKALTYRLLGSSAWSRRIYRKLANAVGKRRIAEGNHRVSLDRALWLLRHLRDGRQGRLRVLEVGTGWTHYYSVFLRLFLDAEFVLFDVVDNRRLRELQARIAWLAEHRGELDMKMLRADAIEAVQAAADFAEIYRSLEMTYLLRADGSLRDLAGSSFDLIFSMDVLEHITGNQVSGTIADYHRLLRPGGLSLHQIGIDDHLSHGNRHASPKQYLQFSDPAWNRLQGPLLYQNRLQSSDFLELFDQAGFELVSVEAERYPNSLEGLKLDSRFRGHDAPDLTTVRTLIVHRKPG